MKKILITLALAGAGISTTAHAMVYFLVSSWTERGDTFCKYSNGTVLNIGVGICKLSIED